MTPLSKHTDDALVRLYIAGQNEAFDELLLRYKDKVFAYISFRVKNADMADDLFQETFVRAIMQIRQGRYNEHGRFYAWILCIVHNLLIDLFRTESRYTTVYNDATDGEWNDSFNLCINSYEENVIDEQLKDDVCRIMNLLPTEQRNIVYMRFYQNMSYKEIAEEHSAEVGEMGYSVLESAYAGEQFNACENDYEPFGCQCYRREQKCQS